MHLTCHKKEINLGSISSHSLNSNFPPLISPTLRILSIQNYCLTITSTSITTVIWDDQRSACCTCISLICTSAQTHILGNIGLQNYILILLLSVLITWSLQVNSNFTFHLKLSFTLMTMHLTTLIVKTRTEKANFTQAWLTF